MLAAGAATGFVGLAAIAATTASGVDPVTRAMRRLLEGRRRPASLANADILDWVAETGTLFTAAGYRLRLAGVRALKTGPRPPELRQRPFIAVFDVVGRSPLPGDLIYEVSHARYPAFDLYLTNAPTRTRPLRLHALFG